MTSAFSWLDHSDAERRKVLEAIDRFKETDTRDELGLASIRDGFSNLFFPGTSVLMTRARYFLFIPWMYLGLEKTGARDDLAKRARKAELQLIKTIGDEEGNIGRVAKETLQRPASNIYWLGLERWGIRNFDGTQAEYHRYLEAGGAARADARDDDGEPLGGRVARSWHANVPLPPAGFPKQASLELTREEAHYLRERIRSAAGDSMLWQLLRNGPLPDAEYPWLHPRFGDLPGSLQHSLSHAQCFAEVMHGAAILYNLMLAEAGNRESVDHFRALLRDWALEMREREREIRAWRLNDFWSLAQAHANVRRPTHDFVNKWVELGTWASDERACDDKLARSLIKTREQQLKGGRARLVNARALELWGGESGTRRLVYRWPTAHRLVSDILEGLQANA